MPQMFKKKFLTTNNCFGTFENEAMKASFAETQAIFWLAYKLFHYDLQQKRSKNGTKLGC